LPKPMRYRANSYIYFRGDASDRIYILNAGKVSLSYADIETGTEMRDLIKMGEFFGVKSAMGHYPREETAVVLQDADVMAFTVSEFEVIASKNTRIIMKMLKVFSNQLRRIHRQVQNLLMSDEQVSPETGLYKIGEYYLRNKRYAQALHAYKRYLVYYPSGAYADDVTHKIEVAENYVSKYGSGPAAPPHSAPAAPPPQASAAARAEAAPARGSQDLSDMDKQYYNAISLVSQEKYQEAYRGFQAILAAGPDEEHLAKVQFEMARCQFYLKQYDACVKGFTALIQKYPKHPDLNDGLYLVGRCYEERGENQKAASLYKKLLTMIGEDDNLGRKVRKSLKAMEDKQ
jgi:TolA-binding protein